MAEWFKAHAWKACVGNTTVSSNLTLSATSFYFPFREQRAGGIVSVKSPVALVEFKFQIHRQIFQREQLPMHGHKRRPTVARGFLQLVR